MTSPVRTHLLAAMCGVLFAVVSTANAQISPDYVLSVGDVVADSGTQVQIDVTLDATQGVGLDGWSFGLCHDGQILSLQSVTGLGDLAMPPVSPIFETQAIEDDGPGGLLDGFNATVVVDFSLMTVFAPTSAVAINTATYTVLGSDSESTALAFCDNLGAFPVAVSVIEGGAMLTPTTSDGSFTVSFPFTPFIRGECNQSGDVDLADGIRILDAVSGNVQPCMDSCDVNGDGNVGVADAVLLFSYLFVNGNDPAPPFPNCGMPAGPNPDCVFDQGLCP